MPIDERELRRTRGLFELITTDRLCGKCKYNLRGLPTNGRCPECGTPVTRAGRRRFSDSLTDAPLFYLKTLAVGAILLAIFSIVGLQSLKYLQANRTMNAAAVYGGATLAWWLGVFIASAKRHAGDNVLP